MCSLEEAFQTFSEPEPRNSEKRRKKRRAVLPPEPEVIEPDRPAHRRLPPAELLGGAPTENTESTSLSAILGATESASASDYFPHPSSDVKDESVYRLEPDWTKVFNNDSAPAWIKDRMPQRDAESPLIPSPWLDGSPTLWQSVSKDPQFTQTVAATGAHADARIDMMQRRIDDMFKKLEDMDVTRSESNHLEIILFVMGGIFLLLLIDLLVKQGTQATMLVAAAGGGSILKRFTG